MKKLFVSLMCCFLFVGVVFADRSTLDDTKTRVAMPLPEPPVIDGLIDLAGSESWLYAGGAENTSSYWVMRFNDTLEDYIEGANIGNGGFGPLDNTDIDVQVFVGYDSDYLYVGFIVVDDSIFNDSATAGSQNGETWLDDSTEVFVDGDNSNFDARDTAGDKPEGWSTGGQYVVTANNAYREAEAGDPGFGPSAPWYGVCEVDGSGRLNYEYRISLDLLGNPQPGDVIGFDLSVNDDDDGDALDNQYVWAGATHHEATYGNLILGPRSYTAPLVTSAPTVDGVIGAGEYGDAPEIQINPYTGNYSGIDEWLPGDHDWSAWVVHTNDKLYIAVDVTDDVISTDAAAAGSVDGETWTDDSVEMFLDTDASDDNGSGGKTGNLWEGQFVMTPNGAVRSAEASGAVFGEDGEWFAATTTTATGYVVEYSIPKDTMFEMQNPMGFDIAVNDDDDGGRKTQLAWNGRPHTELSYGELFLSGSDVDVWELY
ncbi:MAG: sugar-binding protein [Candidatus Hinthialibacter antarcticus]|nr:sugar-binding protein [Candidatus Hinthialibacter antarcticus]